MRSLETGVCQRWRTPVLRRAPGMQFIEDPLIRGFVLPHDQIENDGLERRVGPAA